MSIEQIVQAWKNDEESMNIDTDIPTNPVGEELSDEELQDVTGGLNCVKYVSCFIHLTPFF